MDGVMNEPRAPLVYVLTLNWNGKSWLGECLASISDLDYPNFKVVVVDNGSTDGSVQFVRERFSNVQIIENERNLGYPAGFNIGLAHAFAHGADFCLIVNNDTVIEREALRALVTVAQSRDDAGFVSGKVYFYDSPTTIQTVGKSEDPLFWSGPDIGEGEEDCGQFDAMAERPFFDDIYLLIPRRLYEDVGGYDPQLFLQGEGFDWQIRAKNRGWRLYYTPAARLWHRSGRSMGGRGSPISEYFYVRNHLIVVAKHGGIRRYGRLWLYIGWERSTSLVRGTVGLVLGRKPRMNSRFAGWLGWIDGTLWLLHRRPATGVPWIIRWLQKTSGVSEK